MEQFKDPACELKHLLMQKLLEEDGSPYRYINTGQVQINKLFTVKNDKVPLTIINKTGFQSRTYNV